MPSKRLLTAALSLRFTCLLLVSVLFFNSVLFAHKVEADFWKGRQNQSRQTRPSTSVAALPATLPLHRFPSSILQNAGLSLSKNSDLATLIALLPHNLGTIRKIVRPNNASGQVVIHIQDVHLNAEAQRNIGASIEALITSDQLDLVALEGTADSIDLTAYRNYPYQDSVKKVARYLLRENKITGPIYAALTLRLRSGQALPAFVGVDDEQHYQANIEAYRQALPHVSEVKKSLARVENELEKEKTATFNSALNDFDFKVSAHNKNELSLGEYLNVLKRWSPNTPSDASLFLEALQSEKTLNFKNVERERMQLLTKLSPHLKSAEMDELLRYSAAYKSGAVNHAGFYQFLKNLCFEHAVYLTRYPALNSYVQYVLLADQIDGERLIAGQKEMERAAYAALAKTATEKKLIDQSNLLALMNKLVDFSLSAEEWAEYKGIVREVWNKSEKSEINLSSFEKFYEEASFRDEAMASNLLRIIRQSDGATVRNSTVGLSDRRTAVLVTGGFHSKGIDTRLNAAGITTINFVPKISKIDTAGGSEYLTVFAREKTPLEKMFQKEKLFLSIKPFDRRSPLAALAVVGEDVLRSRIPKGKEKEVFEAVSEITVDRVDAKAGSNLVVIEIEKDQLIESAMVSQQEQELDVKPIDKKRSRRFWASIKSALRQSIDLIRRIDDGYVTLVTLNVLSRLRLVSFATPYSHNNLADPDEPSRGVILSKNHEDILSVHVWPVSPELVEELHKTIHPPTCWVDEKGMKLNKADRVSTLDAEAIKKRKEEVIASYRRIIQSKNSLFKRPIKLALHVSNFDPRHRATLFEIQPSLTSIPEGHRLMAYVHEGVVHISADFFTGFSISHEFKREQQEFSDLLARQLILATLAQNRGEQERILHSQTMNEYRGSSFGWSKVNWPRYISDAGGIAVPFIGAFFYFERFIKDSFHIFLENTSHKNRFTLIKEWFVESIGRLIVFPNTPVGLRDQLIVELITVGVAEEVGKEVQDSFSLGRSAGHERLTFHALWQAWRNVLGFKHLFPRTTSDEITWSDDENTIHEFVSDETNRQKPADGFSEIFSWTVEGTPEAPRIVLIQYQPEDDHTTDLFKTLAPTLHQKTLLTLPIFRSIYISADGGNTFRVHATSEEIQHFINTGEFSALRFKSRNDPGGSEMELMDPAALANDEVKFLLDLQELVSRGIPIQILLRHPDRYEQRNDFSAWCEDLKLQAKEKNHHTIVILDNFFGSQRRPSRATPDANQSIVKSIFKAENVKTVRFFGREMNQLVVRNFTTLRRVLLDNTIQSFAIEGPFPGDIPLIPFFTIPNQTFVYGDYDWVFLIKNRKGDNYAKASHPRRPDRVFVPGAGYLQTILFGVRNVTWAAFNEAIVIIASGLTPLLWVSVKQPNLFSNNLWIFSLVFIVGWFFVLLSYHKVWGVMNADGVSPPDKDWETVIKASLTAWTSSWGVPFLWWAFKVNEIPATLFLGFIGLYICFAPHLFLSNLSKDEAKRKLILKTLHDKWNQLLDRSRASWRESKEEFPIPFNNQAPSIAYDAALLPKRVVGPFTQFLQSDPTTETTDRAVERNSKDTEESNLLHELKSNFIMDQPGNPEYAVIANRWPKTPFASLLVSKKKWPQVMRLDFLRAQLSWAKLGFVTEFHRPRRYVDHLHAHLFRSDFAAIQRYSDTFSDHRSFGDIEAGFLKYPAPHFALTSTNESELALIATQLALKLDEQDEWYNMDVLWDSFSSRFIVVFFLWQPKKHAFGFLTAGMAKAPLTHLTEKDLARYFANSMKSHNQARITVTALLNEINDEKYAHWQGHDKHLSDHPFSLSVLAKTFGFESTDPRWVFRGAPIIESLLFLLAYTGISALFLNWLIINTPPGYWYSYPLFLAVLAKLLSDLMPYLHTPTAVFQGKSGLIDRPVQPSDLDQISWGILQSTGIVAFAMMCTFFPILSVLILTFTNLRIGGTGIGTDVFMQEAVGSQAAAFIILFPIAFMLATVKHVRWTRTSLKNGGPAAANTFVPRVLKGFRALSAKKILMLIASLGIFQQILIHPMQSSFDETQPNQKLTTLMQNVNSQPIKLGLDEMFASQYEVAVLELSRASTVERLFNGAIDGLLRDEKKDLAVYVAPLGASEKEEGEIVQSLNQILVLRNGDVKKLQGRITFIFHSQERFRDYDLPNVLNAAFDRNERSHHGLRKIALGTSRVSKRIAWIKTTNDRWNKLPLGRIYVRGLEISLSDIIPYVIDSLTISAKRQNVEDLIESTRLTKEAV